MRLGIVRTVLSHLRKTIASVKSPDLGDRMAILKPFENPSANVRTDLTYAEREPIAEKIIENFALGYNRVAVEIGTMHLEDFIFCQHTKGSNVDSFLRDRKTLKRISEETGRRVLYSEAVKAKGENEPRFMTSSESRNGVKDTESFYVMLYDSDRVSAPY